MPAAAKAAIKKLEQEILALRETVAEREREVAAYRKSAAAHDSELNDAQAQLASARSALEPFHTKTRDLKATEWPPLHLVVNGQITWGDIKKAAEVGGSFK